MIVTMPFRNSDPSRLSSAKIVIPKLQQLGFQIFLVEQSTTPTPNSTLPWDHKIIVEDDGPINRPKLLNTVFHHFPSEDHYAFCETDMLIEPSEWQKAIEASLTHDVVSPYHSYAVATEEGTAAYYQSGNQEDLAPGSHLIRHGGTLCGGAVIFSWKAFIASGGWDEDVKCLGGDDFIQTQKVYKLGLSYHEVYSTAYHLWHKPWSPSERDQSAENHNYTAEWMNLSTKQIRARIARRNFASIQEKKQ